jgi:predicted cobalt transporter CbtA
MHRCQRTQEFGRNGLLEFGAVMLIPKTPLPPGGVCKVSATVNGRQYNWSFTVADEANRSL